MAANDFLTADLDLCRASASPFPITKSDVTVFRPTRWISIGTAGNLAIKATDGSTVTLALPVGIFPISCIQVLDTNTTAAGIVGYP